MSLCKQCSSVSSLCGGATSTSDDISKKGFPLLTLSSPGNHLWWPVQRTEPSESGTIWPKAWNSPKSSGRSFSGWFQKMSSWTYCNLFQRRNPSGWTVHSSRLWRQNPTPEHSHWLVSCSGVDHHHHSRHHRHHHQLKNKQNKASRLVYNRFYIWYRYRLDVTWSMICRWWWYYGARI